MPENRPLRGDDVVHMTLASPTGTMSPMDVPITLDEIAAYVMAKNAAPETPAAEPTPEPTAEPAAPAA